MTFGMESAYGRLATPNYQQSPAWDFSAYTPAAVVVNLGSNDVYTKIAPELFQERYIKFMAALRETYPQAHIFAMRLFNGWLEQEVKAAVAARTEAGDAQVHYVDTAGWLEGYGTAVPTDYVLKNGPSVHPSSFGHLKAATRLRRCLLLCFDRGFQPGEKIAVGQVVLGVGQEHHLLVLDSVQIVPLPPVKTWAIADNPQVAAE